MVESYKGGDMEHDEVLAREKFRFRTRILFYAGLAGWVLWWLILLTAKGDDSDYWSALGGLGMVTGFLGIYVGAPLMIRAQYSAQEPTPWKIPAIVAIAIPGLLVVFAFFTPPASLINFIFIPFLPLSLYMAIWSITLRIKRKRKHPGDGQIGRGMSDN